MKAEFIFSFVSLMLVGDHSLDELSTRSRIVAEEAMPVAMHRYSGDSLAKIADDRSNSRSKRASAVFDMFRLRIKPGDSMRKVSGVLGNARWLDESELYYFGMLGGWIPVDMNPNDRTYCLHLFRDNDGHSDWAIFFQLSGSSKSGQWKEDGYRFLRGKVGTGGEATLIEFALRSPNGRIEVFGKQRVEKGLFRK